MSSSEVEVERGRRRERREGVRRFLGPGARLNCKFKDK